MVNKANSSMIKGKYSSKYTCSTSYKALSKPKKSMSGMMVSKLQKADILPKCLCQNFSATKGNIAIDNNMPTKGITHIKPSSPPRMPCLSGSCAKAGMLKNKNMNGVKSQGSFLKNDK